MKMCHICLIGLMLSGSVHAADKIPFPEQLEKAAIEIERLDNIYDNSLILGNGDINALLFSSAGSLRLRVTKNDVWDARFDTSQDPAPLPMARIRELAKGDWLKGGAFGGGFFNSDGTPASDAASGWRKPYPCPVMCADVVIEIGKPVWHSIRAGGSLNSCEYQNNAMVMSIQGKTGASNGYALDLQDPKTCSSVTVQLSGTANARYFVDLLDAEGEVAFSSGWTETPEVSSEKTFPLSQERTIGRAILYTWTEDGKLAENRFESLALTGEAGTRQVDLTRVPGGESSSTAKLDIRRACATVNYKESDCGVEVRALANANVFLIRSEKKLDLKPPKISFLPTAETGQTDGISWLHQKLPGDESGDWKGMEYALAIASRGSLHAVAVINSFEAKDVKAQAMQLAIETLKKEETDLVAKHEAVWTDFWAASGVCLSDDFMNRTWYRNLYFFRCVSKPGVACPGLFAGMFGSSAAWHGGHTMNYNAEQTYWTPFATNHCELAEPYVRMITEYRTRARWLCRKLFDCDGEYYPHNIFVHEPLDPEKCKSKLGRQFFWMSWSYSHCVSGFAVQNLWFAYKYAPDRSFLESTAYPAVREVAIFYANFIDQCDERPEGKVVLGPTVSPEHYGWTHKLKYNRNCTFDIAMFRYIFEAAIEGATELGTDENLVERWKAAMKRLPDYPTTDGDKPVVVDVQDAPPGNYNIAVPATPVFPSDVVTWFSPQEEKELFERTIAGCRWNGNNSVIILSVARARLSMPGTLDWMLEEFKARTRPNGTLTLNRLGHGLNNFGHYTEQFAASMAISELLVQSVGDIIRVFPAWPKEKDAHFADLRAQGGFLVSAQQDRGEVVCVNVVSTVGGELRMLSPWPRLTVQREGVTQTLETNESGVFSLPTNPGERLRFKAGRKN